MSFVILFLQLLFQLLFLIENLNLALNYLQVLIQGQFLQHVLLLGVKLELGLQLVVIMLLAYLLLFDIAQLCVESVLGLFAGFVNVLHTLLTHLLSMVVNLKRAA